MTHPPDRSMAARQVRTTAVGMDVKAEIGQLSMLRAIAETAAMVAGFRIDEVTDLRVTVDEIATCLMRHAVPDTLIRCEFTADRQRMLVRLRAVSASPDPIDESGFGWQLLQANTDHIEIETGVFDAEVSGYPVEVVFERARSVNARS